MNYHLLRHDYAHAIVEMGERAEYLSAIEEANAGRRKPFAAFILRNIVRSIRRLSDETGHRGLVVDVSFVEDHQF